MNLYDELIEKSLTVNTFYNLLMLPLPFLSSSTNGPRERHFQQLLYHPGIIFLTEYKNIENRCHTVLKPAERSPEWQLDLKSIQIPYVFGAFSGRVG